jgi:hypothetical protein
MLALCATPSAAQVRTNGTTATPTTASTTSTTAASTGKVNKALDNTNAGIDNFTNTTDKTKKTFESVSKLFKPKTPNEMLVVIPGIAFEDENLDLLKEAIQGLKDVKKAYVGYEDNIATITVVIKGKGKSDFWLELTKEMKDLFKMKNKQENTILVAYKNAVQDQTEKVPVNNKRTEAVETKVAPTTPTAKGATVTNTAVKNTNIPVTSQQPKANTVAATGATTKVVQTKAAIPAPQSIYLQFQKDGVVHEMTNVYATLQTDLGLLGTGIAITFLEVSTNRLAIFTLTDGRNGLKTGKYTFKTDKNKIFTLGAPPASVEFLMAFQAETKKNSFIAASITSPDATANITSGFVEITRLDLENEWAIEGKFQLDLAEWVGKTGEKMPGCSIKEGSFRATLKK